jgi:hypothetical protein
MTTLTYGHSTQHSGANRLTAGLAVLAAFFKQWTSVSRELAAAGQDPKLSPRAKRLLRAGY